MKRAFSLIVYIAGFLILVSLGTWQVQRAAWKDRVIAQLDKVYAVDVKATPVQSCLEEGYDKDHICAGYIGGRFVKQYPALYWPHVMNSMIGLYIVNVFQKNNGEYVLVNRGWVPLDIQTDMPAMLPALPTEEVTVAGIMRRYEVSVWSPENNLQTNRWYRQLDDQIAAFLNINPSDLSPYMMFAEAIEPGGGAPYLAEIKRVRDYPNDNHMQYALFWFTLAALWGGILGVKLFK